MVCIILRRQHFHSFSKFIQTKFVNVTDQYQTNNILLLKRYCNKEIIRSKTIFVTNEKNVNIGLLEFNEREIL
jgi:hypothetical protein